VRHALALVLALCVAAMALGEGPNDARAPTAGPLLTLADGAWLLPVDRVWRGSQNRLPSTPLVEEEYVPLQAGPVYRLEVSGDGTRIVIAEPNRLLAEQTEGDLRHAVYEMTEGTFSGGRLIVFAGDDGSLTAELTVFGSGLPILSSQRGTLRRVRRRSP